MLQQDQQSYVLNFKTPLFIAPSKSLQGAAGAHSAATTRNTGANSLFFVGEWGTVNRPTYHHGYSFCLFYLMALENNYAINFFLFQQLAVKQQFKKSSHKLLNSYSCVSG